MDTQQTAYPLVNPAHDRDACGVGMIASRQRTASHALVRDAVECLVRLDHRGAKAADGTGDGAGLLTQIPYRVLERDLGRAGIDTPGHERLGLLMVFLPKDDPAHAKDVIESAIAAEGLEGLLWRAVPTDPKYLGDRARQLMPGIEQYIVAAPEGMDDEGLERSLYLVRRKIERVAEAEGLDELSIPSASG
ncbi:MAG: glutamate synthase subunit alpha, partial [Acidimicrobiia bacterium]|nr:glutamate synthase subunit alpha [Acidimicrobiia bacterium]